MNADFYNALDLLEKEKGIPKDYMIEKIELALANACRKEVGQTAVIRVQIDPVKQGKEYAGYEEINAELPSPTAADPAEREGIRRTEQVRRGSRRRKQRFLHIRESPARRQEPCTEHTEGEAPEPYPESLRREDMSDLVQRRGGECGRGKKRIPRHEERRKYGQHRQERAERLCGSFYTFFSVHHIKSYAGRRQDIIKM